MIGEFTEAMRFALILAQNYLIGTHDFEIFAPKDKVDDLLTTLKMSANVLANRVEDRTQ